MAKKKKISPDQGIGPTRERASKPDYEGTGKRRYRVDALLTLRKAGRIDSAAESAALDWIKTVAFAGVGYTDPPEGARECRIEFDETGAPIVGDAITAGLIRSRAADLLRIVREIIGPEQNDILSLVLIEGLSFRALADRISPGKSIERAAQEQAVACSSILSVLPGAMRMARKYQRDMRLAEIDKSRRRPRGGKIRVAEFAGPS